MRSRCEPAGRRKICASIRVPAVGLVAEVGAGPPVQLLHQVTTGAAMGISCRFEPLEGWNRGDRPLRHRYVCFPWICLGRSAAEAARPSQQMRRKSSQIVI